MSTYGYVRDLRDVIGPRPVNFVGAAALITDTSGRILLGQRVGRQTWGVPGGISELGEALPDTLRREVHEETGLYVHAAELLDVISGPDTHRRSPNGDEFYTYTALYRVTAWSGTPEPDGVEFASLAFFDRATLPTLGGPVTRRAAEAHA